MERRIELFAENTISFDYWRNKMSVDNFSGCTAFSITCEEVAAGKDAGNSEKIEFRSFLVDLFRHKDNT